jgi:WhiB family redox-sensing transcriptional regulator
MTPGEEWKLRGNCNIRHVDPDIMFPGVGQNKETAKAKAVCEGCPVKGVCLDYALTNFIKHGVWGGTTERQRQRMRRERRESLGLGRPRPRWIDRGVA